MLQDISLFNGEVEHKIVTGNSHNIRQKMRKTPLEFQKEEKENLQQLLEKRIIFRMGFISSTCTEERRKAGILHRLQKTK